MTWFRGMERRGIPIRWLPYDLPDDEFLGEVGRMIESYGSNLKQNISGKGYIPIDFTPNYVVGTE